MWLKHRFNQFKNCPFCGEHPDVGVTFSEWFDKECNITQDFVETCGGAKLPDEAAGYNIHVTCIGCGITMTAAYGCNGIGYPESVTKEMLLDPLFYDEKINTGWLAHKWNKRVL